MLIAGTWTKQAERGTDARIRLDARYAALGVTFTPCLVCLFDWHLCGVTLCDPCLEQESAYVGERSLLATKEKKQEARDGKS